MKKHIDPKSHTEAKRFLEYINVTENIVEKIIKEGGLDGDVTELRNILKPNTDIEIMDVLNTYDQTVMNIIEIIIREKVSGEIIEKEDIKLPEYKEPIKTIKRGIKGKVYYISKPQIWEKPQLGFIKERMKMRSNVQLVHEFNQYFGSRYDITRTKSSIESMKYKIRRQFK